VGEGAAVAAEVAKLRTTGSAGSASNNPAVLCSLHSCGRLQQQRTQMTIARTQTAIEAIKSGNLD
jgi:hypothetical protein